MHACALAARCTLRPSTRTPLCSVTGLLTADVMKVSFSTGFTSDGIIIHSVSVTEFGFSAIESTLSATEFGDSATELEKV